MTRQRDKDAVLVGAAFDPDQLPKPREVNAAEEIKPIPKEETSAHKGPKAMTNTQGNAMESTPSIPVKEKQDKARTGQDRSEKTLKSIPVVSVPPSTEKISDKPVLIKPDKASKEQIKGQKNGT